MNKSKPLVHAFHSNRELKSKNPRINRVSVLTCGEVAQLLQVAPRTVSEWMSNGILKGFRLPPGKKSVKASEGTTITVEGDRRFRIDDVIDFCNRYEMPIPAVLRQMTGPELSLSIGLEPSEMWPGLTPINGLVELGVTLERTAFDKIKLVIISDSFGCYSEIINSVAENHPKCQVGIVTDYGMGLPKYPLPVTILYRPLDPRVVQQTFYTKVNNVLPEANEESAQTEANGHGIPVDGI